MIGEHKEVQISNKRAVHRFPSSTLPSPTFTIFAPDTFLLALEIR